MLFVRQIIIFYSLEFFCSIYGYDSVNSSSSSIKYQTKVGHCSAKNFYKTKQMCSYHFFLTILGPNRKVQDCSCKYIKLQSCLLIALDNCLRDSLIESILGHQTRIVVKNFRTMIGSEEKWCQRGGLSFSDMIYEGVNCHPIYAYAIQYCVANYEATFRKKTTKARLCREYSLAKTCILRNFLTHCSYFDDQVRQMMEILIEAQLEFQPYCSTPLNNTPSFDQLVSSIDRCPPYAYSDVMFLLDASSSVTKQVFESMKRLVARLIQRMVKDEPTAIRIGVSLFHEINFKSIDLNRFLNGKTFLQKLQKIRMPSSNITRRRMIGRTLMKLAAKQFSLGQNTAVVRPFHTPTIIVLTDGPSEDSLVESIRVLNENRIHVVRFGPTLITNHNGHDVTYGVNNTQAYETYIQEVIDEICFADSIYRVTFPTSNLIEEASYLHSTSPLGATRQHIFSRTSGLQLPLFWEPKALHLVNFTIWHNDRLNKDKIDLLNGGYPDPEYFYTNEFSDFGFQIYDGFPILEASSTDQRIS